MSMLKPDNFSSKAGSYLSLPLAPSPTPSQPSSPGISSLTAPVNQNIQHVYHRRVLLMPAVRPPRLSTAVSYPTRTTRVKHHADSKLARSRHLSIPTMCIEAPANPLNASHWFASECKFEVVREHVEVAGYQMYAVEKWIVERTRPVVVLVVYTGDPSHKIIVTALSPLAILSQNDAEVEWEKALHDLRQDGARPRETDSGTLMVTSLANFRSDYTIVHVPSGNYMDIREQMFTNINLLRMGCSGRSALTLEEPSETTKDRFIQMYAFPDKIRSQELFSSTVLELVRLIQAALSIFNMFEITPDERDGLLCDVTVDGIQMWIAAIGEPVLNVEPMERVADPIVVAGLLSVVIATRNRLYILGNHHLAPKDPFIEPYALVAAFYAFQHNAKNSPNPSSEKSDFVPLTLPLFRAIETAYLKSRQTEPFKVHKVLLNKIDDLKTDLRATGAERDGDFGDGAGMGQDMCAGTARLDVFVNSVLTNRKEGAPSVRWLWTARAEQAERKRRERVLSDTEKDAEDKAAAAAAADTKSTDDEGDEVNAIPWSGRMQKKIESWAGLSRKKQSVDLSAKSKSPDSQTSPQLPSTIPTVVISGDNDDDPASRAGSPILPSRTATPMLFRESEETGTGISDYDRRVTEFNRKRPSPKAGYQSRVSSWSDPVSAREILDVDEPRGRRKMKPSRLGQTTLTVEDDDAETASMDGSQIGTVDEEFDAPKRRIWLQGARRRHSFTNADAFRHTRVLPAERMRIDVELCGQLLVMQRRERHLEGVLSCLQLLTNALASTNSSLRSAHQTHQRDFPSLEERLKVVSEIERERSLAETMTQDTNALVYESAQFRVADMWRAASAPRLKVFAMREKVFGAGRKLPQGVSGAHGHYNRVQWRLAGGQRLVDQLGRTEEEAEEEHGLPRVARLEEEDDEVDAVPHPSLRPTWLLRFFHTWGARWGAGKAAQAKTATEPADGRGLDRRGNLSTVQEVDDDDDD